MSAKKHIVILTPGFSSSEEDSTNIPALQVYLESLKKLNRAFDIKIIAFQYPNKTQEYLWRGITVYPLNGRNKKTNKILVWKKAWSQLKLINKHKPIDHIHSFWIGECSFIGEKFASKYNIKHLVTAMGQDVTKPNIYAKIISQKKSRIVTLSKRHQWFLKTNFNLESEIVSWGIDKSEFPNLQDKTIDILGVGSLNSIKNYTLFVRLIDALKTESLKVELIGDGILRNDIENEIRKHQLENTIVLVGKLPRESVLVKMAKAKILLHTSQYESFGYVFLEALYSGMKIVSFDVGIAKESPFWKVCKDKNEALKSLNYILSEQKEQPRILLHTIENTVLQYCNIYDE